MRAEAANRAELTLVDVEREYEGWLKAKQAASGRDSFHAICDAPGGATLCYLGGCDVGAAALAEANVAYVLSLVSSRRNQKAAAADGEFTRLVIDVEDEFDADLNSALRTALPFLDQAAAKAKLCYVHCELGRSRSASVVIAWLMHRCAKQRQPVSLLACWAAVARTRRISALNYGFFARLIDLERRLNGPYALAGLSCEPSITLLDYVRLPLLDASQFAFRPVPTLAELVEESRHDENEPGASKRQAALRRLMRNLRFVLVQLQASSPACARALAALMEG